jgi:2-haloacid dehalogenase
MTTGTSGKLENIKACVFDAYGTLFDVNAAAAHCADDLGDKWQPLAEIWRTKQLQYTWLRSLMKRHVEFWQLTTDALDYALDTVEVSDAALRQKLLDLYLQLDAYDEVTEVLTALKDGGLKTAILSNGSPDMLASAVSSAGLDKLLDATLSVEDVGIYKPAPSVYQMALDHFSISAPEVSFQSSNAWDAAGAATFGFRVVWVNRFGQAPERLPDQPDIELTSLSDLPSIVGV